MKKNIIIIGIGKRCQNDFLPALLASDSYNIVGIYARSNRTVLINEKTYLIKQLDELTNDGLKNVDWVYLGVPIINITPVLKFLSSLSVGDLNLLIDTPVFPWRYMMANNYTKKFLKVVVAEDIIHLPWIEPLKDVIGGKFSKIIFEHSVYAYHGIALIKALTKNNFKKVILKNENGKKVIEIETDDGTFISMIEPRDYSKGSMTFYGPEGVIKDSLPYTNMSMYPIISNGNCTGLKIGIREILFSNLESNLIGRVSEDATITSLTLQLKRIGILTMVKGLAEGKNTGWSLENSISDIRLYELVLHFGQFFNIARILKLFYKNDIYNK